MKKEILNKLDNIICKAVYSFPETTKQAIEIHKDVFKEIKQLLQAEDEYKWICDTCNRNCKMKREIEPKAYKYCDIHQRYVNWQPINKQEKK